MTLLNIMSKALKFMMTCRISYMTEIYQLLFKILLKNQKIVFTEQAIHTLLKQIYRVWELSMSVTLLLMLNILEVFNNVFHKRLLHNLQKYCLSLKIVNWIEDFLRKRTLTIKLLKYESESFVIHINIF